MGEILRWFGYIHLKDIRKESLRYDTILNKELDKLGSNGSPLDVYSSKMGQRDGNFGLLIHLEKWIKG